MSKAEISVNYEWGKLKEVIVGTGDGLRMPEFSDKVDFIYDKNYIEQMKRDGGKPASEVEPETTAAVISQINHLVSVLEEKGIKVHRPRLLNELESKYMSYIQGGQMQIYSRDPILVIGNKIIETSLKVPMRAKEKFPLREILTERIEGTSAQFISMPSANPNYGEDGIYLEGGDVMLNGKEIYVGNSGKASNEAGIAWLGKTLGPGYKVIEVKLSSEFEHLDCVLALLKPGLALCCTDGITGDLPESIRDWDLINVSIQEAKHLAANALVLDEKTAIIDSQHQRIIEEVRKWNHEVIEVPYDKVATWGGAFRCSHHPLIRE